MEGNSNLFFRFNDSDYVFKIYWWISWSDKFKIILHEVKKSTEIHCSMFLNCQKKKKEKE